MSVAERALLLALIRWARTEGDMEWGALSRWIRRKGPREQWFDINYDPDRGDFLSVYWGRGNTQDYWVRSVTEAVDILVAVGLVPPRFSSAYRAGWVARMDTSAASWPGFPGRAS